MKVTDHRYDNLLKIVSVAALYFVLAVASLPLSFHSSNATPVWPASGFAFAMVLLWKPRAAYGIFLGAFSANAYIFLSQHHLPVFQAVFISLVIGIGNALEALTGYYLLNRFLPAFQARKIFKTVRSVNRFVLVALLMCFTSCTIGSSAILLSGNIISAEFPKVWFTWWTGDVSGILLITPLIISWSYGKWTEVTNVRVLQVFEILFLTAMIILTSGTVFENLFYAGFVFTRAFVITPFLIWAAIRLEPRLVTLLVLFSAAIAIEGSLRGVGPFIGPGLNESLLTVEAFISINAVMALLLNAANLERKQKEIALRTARNNLEAVVAERTKELYEKNEQLQKRNSELTLFSFAISHDLQEPFRKLEFFSNKILEEEKGLSEKGKDYFQRMRLTTIRTKQLIENLLTYAIVEGNKRPPENTDLNLVLLQVKNDLADKIHDTGAVIESGFLPVVSGIPLQLHELFANIISNSIKFRKQDEPLSILIECEKLKGSALSQFEAAQEQEYYHLAFTDNGIGFEQEYAITIFEILQKLHGRSEYEGTGIGLAICRKVVENHKGFIEARGEPGKGCSIHVYLPVDKTIVLRKLREADQKEVEFS